MLARIAKRVAFEFKYLPARIIDGTLSLLSNEYKYRHGMIDMDASLKNMRQNGFRPGSVIDVGAYQGLWAEAARRIYPDVPILMIEANRDKESVLASMTKKLGGMADYRIALLGADCTSSVPYYVMGTGSSVLPETTAMPRSVIDLDMTTLDEITSDQMLPTPYFIKLDVQGYELEVLRGAERLLKSTEVLMLEVALMEYNQGAPLLADVVAFMQSRGFVAYDIAGFYRRVSDDALFMVDILFALENSALRAKKPFWNETS